MFNETTLCFAKKTHDFKRSTIVLYLYEILTFASIWSISVVLWLGLPTQVSDAASSELFNKVLLFWLTYDFFIGVQTGCLDKIRFIFVLMKKHYEQHF